MPRKKRRPVVLIEIHERSDPTKQRLDKSRNAAGVAQFTLGDGNKQLTFKDSQLDHALDQGLITVAQHAAGERYYEAWYLSGMGSGLSAIDYRECNSDGAGGEGGGGGGYSRTDEEAYYRDRYREGRKALGLGMRANAIEAVICDGAPLVGWPEDTLARGLDALRALWRL